MLSVLSDLLMGDDIVKLQGYRWKKNGVEFKIDSCSDEKNRRASLEPKSDRAVKRELRKKENPLLQNDPF